MDDIGLTLCKIQADIFEKSKEYCKCSSEQFIKRFMKSNLASRIDRKLFIFEATDVPACFEELNIKPTKSLKQYPSYVLSWMGYLYRYMCYEYKTTSGRAYKIISASELAALYEPYHSLDIDQAIRRIFEAKNIDSENVNFDLELAKKIYLEK